MVEILSPGNPPLEARDKFALYEASKVQEYWLIYPLTETVNVYILNEEGAFVGLQPLTSIDKLTSHFFPELTVNLEKVFIYDGED